MPVPVFVRAVLYDAAFTFIGKSNPEEDLCKLTPKLAEPIYT